jgi:hypothetical protein
MASMAGGADFQQAVSLDRGGLVVVSLDDD